MESEQATPGDSTKNIVRSSVKVPEFVKHLKKVGGHIGRNVVEITIKMKTIVRKPLMIKNHQASSQKFRQLKHCFFSSMCYVQKVLEIKTVFFKKEMNNKWNVNFLQNTGYFQKVSKQKSKINNHKNLWKWDWEKSLSLSLFTLLRSWSQRNFWKKGHQKASWPQK